MKISLNSIRRMNERYGGADDVAAIGVDKLVEKIGAQLGAVEEVIDLGKKYRGIVIAKIVGCEPHPNADRLQICTIDDGGNTPDVNRDEHGYVQVVCGAPNARTGLTVAWLPPGATVPETVGKDSFTLEARELRGVVSNGMLASPKELALGDSHLGILEIDGDHQPGSDFAEVFGLKDDIVLDIENKMFTHRPDCFGFLGISRELAGIQQLPFKSPEWYLNNRHPEFISEPVLSLTGGPHAQMSGVPDQARNDEELKLELRNELPELVPRFSAIALSNVQVGPSPVWLQVELAKVGARSINNIVDYTNFFMLETGQPLHAYDYDKVQALSDGDVATIVVRHPHAGEKVVLLNGKTIEPRAEAIMIATDKQLIGIGGVMGGADTEVDENTKNIILECANFDMYSIRRTSMAHGLFTDAVTRFNKGQSPLQNLAVLAKITDEIVRYADGKIASPLIDDTHFHEDVQASNSLYPAVTLTVDFINDRLGLQLAAEEVKQLLENVEFHIGPAPPRHPELISGPHANVNGVPDQARNDGASELVVTAPFWRTDIELPEDVVEEVGRLYGYDKLPLKLPKRDLTPTKKDPLLELKAKVRTRLSKAGANEVLTYSFVHGNLLEKTGQDKEKAFQLSNALSPDLQYYRISLMPSLLEKVHSNIKAGYDEFALFELGRTHSLAHKDDEAGLPKEFEFTALVVTANAKLKKAGAVYYQAQKYLSNLAGVQLEFKPIGDDMLQYSVTQPYDVRRSALVSIKKSGEFLGIIGEFKQSVRHALKLPKYTAGFEVDTTALQAAYNNADPYVALPRYPAVSQDMTLRVPANLTYQELFDFVWSELNKARPKETFSSLGPRDIYQSKDDTDHKQVTFHLTIASYERTLTDSEVNNLLDTVAQAVAQKFDAERI